VVGDLTGKWVIAPVAETFAGYRIGERVASIEAAEVVGRTRELEGTVKIDDQHLVSASITADMTQLKSDQEERDKALGTQALETDTHSTAGFELTEPLRLPESLANGEAVTVSARGELTVHGVTRAVEIPLDAQVSHGMLIVVSSFEITLADYEIDQSTAAFIASIEERALVELQLFFAPA
jgi:polyisoprenoid-binding protein YceI